MKLSRKFDFGLSVALGLAGFYCVLGVLQAASLFTGTRALSNANIWGSAALILYAFSLVLLFRPGRLLVQLPVYARWLIAGGLAAASIYSGWQLLHELVGVDACLDRGGSYNYPAFVCDYSGTHPAMHLFNWLGLRITWTAALILSSLAVGVLAVRGARPNNSFKPNPLRSGNGVSG